MAVLGSTVDPRLGAVSPAAIQALSQAGAATGQMYANLGRSIAGVVQDQAQRKTDAKIAEILDQSTIDEKDEEGNLTGFKSLAIPKPLPSSRQFRVSFPAPCRG